NATITSIPENITTDQKEIEKISSSFRISEEEIISYDEYFNAKSDKISELENKPFAFIESNKDEILFQYEDNKVKYNELKNHITSFESKLDIEKLQQQNINNQLIVIEKEIKEHNNLIKVFNNNLFKKNK